MDKLLARLQKRFADTYRVETELKGGGMSRLFLATDLALNRKVVIKILPPELTSDMMAARFKRESEVTAHLQHPNILPVITAGLKDGLLYYVMPFISGESLRERLRREHELPVRDSVSILCEVASALAYAHKQGVIHRDIKPENILLQDGHAILADFGIAAALVQPGETPQSRITRTGMSMGTVGYMAPEQSLGGTDVDSRADIYSLGVVGHEMLAGEPPFGGATTQAILAAHLTKPPPRLDKLRDDVPIPVCKAIEKALEKDPAKRFQTADEFAAACQGPAPRLSRITRGVAVRKLRRVSKWKIAAGVLLLLVVFGGGMYIRYRAPAGPQETVILAVAPFEVSPDLTLWHEGMVDLLARNIDGAGPLRTVSPILATRNWPKGAHAEANSALKLARDTKATYVIYGTLVPSTGESVRLHGTLLDAGTGQALIDLDTLAASPQNAADVLTIRALKELGKRHRIGATRATSIGSSSPLALKAFLQGEQYYRATSWDSAAVSYGQAIAQDSGFALALRRAGQVSAWQNSETDSLARAFALHAGARNRSLGPRDSLLIAADSLSSALESGDPNLPDWRISRRLFATVNDAAAKYPDDPEVWYIVGEARFHHGYGSIFDISEEQVRDAFRRSIALDSAFTPAYIHIVELAFNLGGAKEGREAAHAYLARNPGGKDADGIRLLDVVTDPHRAKAPEAQRLFDTASTAALLDAWVLIRRWPDSGETALRFLRAVARRPHSSPTFVQDSVQLQNSLPLQLAYRGRFREAYFAIGTRPSRLFGQLALYGIVQPDTALAVFSRWLAANTPQVHTALPWWAARGDTASILRLARAYDSTLRASRPELRSIAKYNSDAARAYLLLARHDTTGALTAFSALSDTLCLRCDMDRLTTARLLAARNHLPEADRLLRQRLFSSVTPAEVGIALERGRVAEQAKDRPLARKCYRFVVDAWDNGDPEARAFARQAREGLGRVGT